MDALLGGDPLTSSEKEILLNHIRNEKAAATKKIQRLQNRVRQIDHCIPEVEGELVFFRAKIDEQKRALKVLQECIPKTLLPYAGPSIDSIRDDLVSKCHILKNAGYELSPMLLE